MYCILRIRSGVARGGGGDGGGATLLGGGGKVDVMPKSLEREKYLKGEKF